MKLISHLNQNVRFIQAQALTSKSLKSNNLGGFMEVKELRDLIKVIHDSGDCGQTLSDVLEMANKICEQPSDLEIVQKALEIEDVDLTVHPEGSSAFTTNDYKAIRRHFSNNEDLLAWAKQTIGVE